MVTIVSLWLPILISAVLIFVVSSIIHMAVKYHNSDFKPVPEEDAAMAALREFQLAPGDYSMPCQGHSQKVGSPELNEKGWAESSLPDRKRSTTTSTDRPRLCRPTTPRSPSSTVSTAWVSVALRR